MLPQNHSMTESTNLILKPLTKKQLAKYLKHDGSLERELKLNNSQQVTKPEVVKALTENILPYTEDAGKNHLFTELWVIILKEESKIIGNISFLSRPDVDGEVEIAYRIFEQFRRNGYMTEALDCILEWVKRQDFVKSIFAQTAQSNIPSWRILAKNNFEKVGEDELLFDWRLKFSYF